MPAGIFVLMPTTLKNARLLPLLTAIALFAVPLHAQTPDSVAVDAVFASWTGRNTPGCAVGVSRNGVVTLTRAYGMANLEYDVPNTPATIFEAGSVSKQFTAASVALLATEGKLSLDDRIRKHFPELPPYGDSITVRQLLNHTSGLRDWGTVAAAAGWPRGTRTYTHTHVLDIIKRQRALNYTPGAEYLYSNSNYNLAAMLVERVAGMSLPQFTRTRFFEPLGMSSTSWRDDYARIVKNRATAYAGVANAGFRQDMPFENVYGNSSLLTTVTDLLRWNEYLGKGAPAALRQLMHERARLNNGDTLTYALGIVVEDYRGVREVNHTGATAGYRAYLGRFPDQGIGVALLCNSGNANPGALGHQVANVFLGNALRPVVPPTTPAGPGAGFVRVRSANGDTLVSDRDASWKPSAADLAQYAGRYTSDEAETSLTFSVQDGALMATDRYGSSARLTPVYRDAFIRNGQLFRFRRDVRGTVNAVSLGLGRVRDLRFAKSATR